MIILNSWLRFNKLKRFNIDFTIIINSSYLKYFVFLCSSFYQIYFHNLHSYIYIYIYIYKEKVKLATLVEGDPKAPFSIATTQRCRGGRYSIPRIAPLYLWSIPRNAECLAKWHQVPFFESLVWLYLGLNPGLPGHWWTLYSLGQLPRIFESWTLEVCYSNFHVNHTIIKVHNSNI